MVARADGRIPECVSDTQLPHVSNDEASRPQPRQISAEEFVRRLVRRPDNTSHALLLGAGCSASSGIPTAETLVEEHWLPRLREYKHPEESRVARAIKGRVAELGPNPRQVAQSVASR